MARFQLSNDARKYFSKIMSQKELFPDLFDFYYICLIAGFSTGRIANLPSTDLVDYYIENYRPAKNFLIGLLVVSELKKSGIGSDEKEAVRKKIKQLVDPSSSTQLSDEGMKRMDEYANGGYEYIYEKRPDKPYSGEVFLEDFVLLMTEVFKKNDKS